MTNAPSYTPELALLKRTVEKKYPDIAQEFNDAVALLMDGHSPSPQIQNAIVIRLLDEIYDRAPRLARKVTVSAIDEARKSRNVAFEEKLVCAWGNMLMQDEKTDANHKMGEILVITRHAPQTLLKVKAQELESQIHL